MTGTDRILITSIDGVHIYGRVLDHTGRLGRYEVVSDYWGHDGNVYYKFSDAEARFKYLISLHERREAAN